MNITILTLGPVKTIPPRRATSRPAPSPARAGRAASSDRGAPPAPLPETGSFAAPAGATLAAGLRAHLADRSWNEVRRLCELGKITVDGVEELDPARRLRGGEAIAWRMNTPDARRRSRPSVRIVHEDPHLVVIDKPEGVSSVPYERRETGTALDLIREVWRRKGRAATVIPLYVVHRIDKDTSGLLCFAKTKLGEKGLHLIFKQHLADRRYLAVAHGRVAPGRIASRLVADRGDGLRGSARRGDQEGQDSVTHLEVLESLPAATFCRVRLETGRTHQIRIHLSESGHPLVGETVYIRDYTREGKTLLPASRMLLHAATLGFEHPVTRERLDFESPLPPDFQAALDDLR
jgi:23S rRNA pseudouridine1911/1915/1917 synthase